MSAVPALGESGPRITVADVQRTIVARYDVTLEEMLSTVRAHRIMHARHIAYWLSRRLTGKSLPWIADRFRREHSAVMVAVRNLEARRAEEPDLRRELDLIELAIRDLAGRGDDPADRDAEPVAGVQIARAVLLHRDRLLSREEGKALARAYLDLALGRTMP